MNRALALLMTALCAGRAAAATITVTITGTTGEIRVGEGPIFEHSSYQKIPPGAPFSLTYTFDDEKGKQTIPGTSRDLITQSEAEDSGTNAVLQIGTAVWEFGAATHSRVVLKTAAGRSEEFLYTTQAGSNRISAQITPAPGSYWPRNGDWRSSFTAAALAGSTASFSADNDHVSATGSLLPAAITVSGVDLDGQWLRPSGQRKWQLAHASPKGGSIVEQVITTIRGIREDGSPITPACIQYWQARAVAAGATAPADAVADSPLSDSTGEVNVTVVARFYEGLALASNFYACTDPKLPTSHATLPVTAAMTHRLER